MSVAVLLLFDTPSWRQEWLYSQTVTCMLVQCFRFCYQWWFSIYWKKLKTKNETVRFCSEESEHQLLRSVVISSVRHITYVQWCCFLLRGARQRTGKFFQLALHMPTLVSLVTLNLQSRKPFTLPPSCLNSRTDKRRDGKLRSTESWKKPTKDSLKFRRADWIHAIVWLLQFQFPWKE
jgi:hypothetical protein